MSDLQYIIMYYGFPILGLILTSVAQLFITTNYSKYKKVLAKSHQSGREVARKILDKHGLKNIEIESVEGNLTDHYDPTKKVVRLSNDIYSGTSIASVSVAAHECGHAIQDKVGYTPMRVRSKLVPVVNFSTKIGYIVIMLGLALGILKLANIGIILLSTMLMFQIITLPVEFDASRRGKKELADLNILDPSEQKGSARMLKAAAFTYVASVLTTLLQILRFVVLIAGRRRD